MTINQRPAFARRPRDAAATGLGYSPTTIRKVRDVQAKAIGMTDFTGRIWFTTGQAADYAGCNVQTVAAACRAGTLRAGQPFGGAGGRWRIHRDDLDAWLRGGPRR